MKTIYSALAACFILTACNTSISTGEEEPNDDAGNQTPIATQPNILFILSDDQGIDASAQYNFSTDLPNTPTLDNLASKGLVFDNAWVTPACSTTRAALLTGQYGFNSGISSVPGNLSASTETIQSFLKSQTATQDYQTGFFGKWHLGGDENRPNDIGADFYAGQLGNVPDYYDWELTQNGQTTTSTTYNTTAITDLAIDWINNLDADKPWFTWLAYSAPHGPFHLPPADLHSRNLSGEATDIEANPREYFLAAIEAMDNEIGRLLSSLPDEVRENTIVIYIGDNGSPAKVTDRSVLERGQNKDSFYEGGIRAPLVISGAGVTRQNERESGLVNSTDFFATIAELAGLDLAQKHDGRSFIDLLSDSTSQGNDYLFVNYNSDKIDGYAIRNQEFKLIESSSGTQAFYQLNNQTIEGTELLASANLTTEQSQAYQMLDNKLNSILGTTGGGGETEPDAIDITDAIFTNRDENCTNYVNSYTSNVLDVNESVSQQGDLKISLVGDKCVFDTNAIPNHDFNDGGNSFPNQVTAQSDQFQVTINPSFAAQVTELSLRTDNALLLNGVKVDLLAAGCFGIGNGKVGCGDMSTPWRYDPMHPANGFNVDTHNAHAQPNGAYHYHGTPNAFYHQTEAVVSPVSGFAADGFPIFGPFFRDENDTIRKAQSSFQLKTGDRPSGASDPGGSYDGAFRDDYEYLQDSGDLDECNGMTIDGVYGYYITDDYPYVLACFKGTVDSSFDK